MLLQLGTFNYVGENSLRISLVRFQNGVVIIDSPGVGESEIMDEMVREYLPEAFAFIYVINCTNAGGVQKDRVSLIRKHNLQ